MALTPNLIKSSPSELTDIDFAIWKELLMSLPIFEKYGNIFVRDLQDRFNSAHLSMKGRQLNALMKLIEKLGSGQVSIRGDKEAVWWSQHEERMALINEAFRILYDDEASLILISAFADDCGKCGGSSTPAPYDPESGNYGSLVSVGDRKHKPHKFTRILR